VFILESDSRTSNRQVWESFQNIVYDGGVTFENEYYFNSHEQLLLDAEQTIPRVYDTRTFEIPTNVEKE
jgi:hypothetical protein